MSEKLVESELVVVELQSAKAAVMAEAEGREEPGTEEELEEILRGAEKIGE